MRETLSHAEASRVKSVHVFPLSDLQTNPCQCNVKRSFNFTRVRLLVCVHRLTLPVINTTSNGVSHFITLKWLLHWPVRLHPLSVCVCMCASFTNCSVLATACTAQLRDVEIDLVHSPVSMISCQSWHGTLVLHSIPWGDLSVLINLILHYVFPSY